MQRLRIGLRNRVHECTCYLRLDIVRIDGQGPVESRLLVIIASENIVSERKLPEHINVSRVKVNCALQVCCGLLPAPLPCLDETHQPEYLWIAGQTLTNNFYLGQGTIIIELYLIT